MVHSKLYHPNCVSSTQMPDGKEYQNIMFYSRESFEIMHKLHISEREAKKLMSDDGGKPGAILFISFVKNRTSQTFYSMHSL